MTQHKINFEEGDDLIIKPNLKSNEKLGSKYWNVPFVNEVETFNETFGKPNNYKPTIGEKKNGNLYMILFLKN